MHALKYVSPLPPHVGLSGCEALEKCLVRGRGHVDDALVFGRLERLAQLGQRVIHGGGHARCHIGKAGICHHPAPLGEFVLQVLVASKCAREHVHAFCSKLAGPRAGQDGHDLEQRRHVGHGSRPLTLARKLGQGQWRAKLRKLTIKPLKGSDCVLCLAPGHQLDHIVHTALFGQRVIANAAEDFRGRELRDRHGFCDGCLHPTVRVLSVTAQRPDASRS